jgi:hypothetical protein
MQVFLKKIILNKRGKLSIKFYASQNDSIDKNYLSLTSIVIQTNFTFKLSFLLVDSSSVFILYILNLCFFQLLNKAIIFKDIRLFTNKKADPVTRAGFCKTKLIYSLLG